MKRKSEPLAGGIPQLVIDDFLRRQLRDYRKYKDLTEKELNAKQRALPIEPPIWDVLRKDQKVCFIAGAETGSFQYFNDCVAGETRIETDRGPVRIDILEREKKPIKIWSLTKDGLRLVKATCPFKKGIANLYNVTLSSGQIITVTDHHVFLTDHGWRFCADLAVGARLPGFAVDLQQSNLESSLLACQPDDPHSYRRPQDCQDHWRIQPCDERLRSGVDSVPTASPLPTVILEHSHASSRMGALDISGRRSPQPAFSHHSRIRYADQDYLSRNRRKFLTYECGSEWSGDVSHSTSITHAIGSRIQQALPDQGIRGLPDVPEVGLSHEGYCCARYASEQLEDYSQAQPLFDLGSDLVEPIHGAHQCPSDHQTLVTVTNIEYNRRDIYYDLHVPQHENYIAHGVCNHNTGTGKTLLSIALHRYFWALEQVNTTLVLVPNEINKWEWADQIQKHSPSTRYVILHGSSTEKWEQLEGNPDATIVVATYMGWMRMLCREEAPLKKRSKKKLRWVPDKKLVRRIQKRIDGLIMDENTAVASKGTLPFRICRQTAKFCKMVFGLTGTPFGRDLELLWAEMFLVDGGETLGKTLGMFRACFFKPVANHFSGFDDWVPDQTKIPILYRTLAHRSLRYKASATDLPKLVHIPKFVELSADAQDYYTKAWERLLAANRSGNWREQTNSFLRARQISSGFLGFTDDEDGKTAEFEFDYKPKLEMLLSILKSIRAEAKILVMHDFVYSGGMITRELSKAKIKHVYLNRKADKEKIKKQFNEDPETRVFVLNTAGAYGLNLQVAQYGIFYERPVNPIYQYQMIRRFERQYSQHDTVFLYDLIAQNTVDQRIIDYFIEASKMLHDVLDADMVELGGGKRQPIDVNQDFFKFMRMAA